MAATRTAAGDATATFIPGNRRDWLRRNWPVLLVGGATLANGLMELLLGLLVRLSNNPHWYSLPTPFGVYHWSRLLRLGFGFLLVYLSFHLLQRRRAAWWLALASLIAVLVAHALHEHYLHLAPVSAVTIILLLMFRRRFTVRSEPRNIYQGVLLMATSLLVALAYGTIGFWLLDRRDFGIDFQWGESLVRTFRAYVLIGNDDLVPHTRQAVWFLDSLGVIGFVALVFAVYSLFRPLAYRLRTLPHERARAAELLPRHARAPESHMALLPDKSYFFAPSGDGFIAYRAANGIALALADPVAAEVDVPALTLGFVEYCNGNGWIAAMLYTLPDFLPVYEKLGLRSLKIGADATVDLERFYTETRMDKLFRKVKRRLEEDGYTTARLKPPHAPEFIRQLHAVSDDWLKLPGRRERSFALGSFTVEYASQATFFVVLDASRDVVAFVNEVPAYRAGMATIDMMRYRSGLPYGMMDYLFQELLCVLRDEGYASFDLGLAPLAGVGERPDATTEEKVVRLVFERLERFFPFEGLRTYKSKFDPTWEDRYLVYQGGPTGLVRTAVAMSRILR